MYMSMIHGVLSMACPEVSTVHITYASMYWTSQTL